MAIYFGSQKINAVVQPFISGVKTTQIGAVSNIRFSLISGKLKVGWTDPDDIYYESSLIASWKKTRLVYNAFPIGTEITYDSYPSSPDNYDGIVLESDWKNKYQYSLYECPTLFDTDKIYCFRFFTCNAFDNWSTDEKFKGSSIFHSGSETWKTLVDKLERFPEMYSEDPAQSVLPQPGGEVDLQYILNDQSKFTKVDFMNSLNTLTAVNAPFVILDYNATVPQYVKYVKENQDGSKTYKWVSSVDDSVKSIQIRNAAGEVRTEKTLTGDMFFRPIIGNCRVYDKLYDPIALNPAYVDTNEVVASSSYDLSCFEYRGNLSAQTINLYKAPMQIRIGSDDYKFVGYTMTIHSKSALYANDNTITFDQDEYQFASPYERFEAHKKYYWKDSTTYVDIDTTELIGKNITTFEVNGVQVDVWSQEKSGDPLVLETARYAYWKPYFKVTSGSVDPDSVVKSFKTSNIFKGCVAGEKVAYSNSIYNVLQDVPTSYVVAPDKDAGTYYQKVGEYATAKMTPCYAWQQGGVYAANTYAYYDSKPWKVIKATTATLVGTPDTLTAYYQVASIGVKNSDWFVEGEKIPCDGLLLCIEQNDGNRTSYGNNLYQESNMRQWLNVAAGRDDDWFVPQNHFDRRVPKTNMYATSNFPLKLAKNDDFFENCIPAANMTRISDVEYQYRSVPNTTRYTGSKRQTVVMDKFFLLSYCEVGFGEYDAMNTFSNIYFNNASRIKYNMGSNGVISTSSAAIWWLRNPITGNSYYEYSVYTSGASDYYNASNSIGCVPACILG